MTTSRSERWRVDVEVSEEGTRFYVVYDPDTGEQRISTRNRTSAERYCERKNGQERAV